MTVEKIVPFRFRLPRTNKSYVGTGPLAPIVTDGTRILAGTDRVTHGGPVPDYKRKIATSQNATSSLTGVRYKAAVIPGGMKRHTATTDTFGGPDLIRYNEISGEFLATQLPDLNGLSSEATANNMALMQFIRKARAAQTSFQGGIFAGELAETMRMIISPGKAFRRGLDDYFSALRKRRRGSPSHRRRVIQDTWLEYSFGWKPFIHDVNDAFEALSNDRSLREQWKHIRATGFSKAEGPKSSYSAQNGSVSAQVFFSNEEEHLVIYRGAVRVDITDPISFQRSNLGLTLDNFVPTLWELIPYSFLVDYFTNIGEVLSAWSFARSNFSWLSRTVVQVSRNQYHCTTLDPKNLSPLEKVVEHSIRPCHSQTEVRLVNRGPFLGSLIPSLEFSHPEWSSLKWLNLAALAKTHNSLRPY